MQSPYVAVLLLREAVTRGRILTFPSWSVITLLYLSQVCLRLRSSSPYRGLFWLLLYRPYYVLDRRCGAASVADDIGSKARDAQKVKINDVDLKKDVTKSDSFRTMRQHKHLHLEVEVKQNFNPSMDSHYYYLYLSHSLHRHLSNKQRALKVNIGNGLFV